MKPKTQIEKEVWRLSCSLPPLAKRYKKQAEKLIDYKNTVRFRGHQTDIAHFIVVTTKGDWQVLRHFYQYGTFKYKKLFSVQYLECMQQWFKDGHYVFMSLNRQMGYCNDAWCSGQQMSIKRGRMEGYVLSDPRDIGYAMTIYANVQDKFSYLPSDSETMLRVDRMFRAVNTNAFWETVIKKDPKLFTWFDRGGFTEDKEKTAAAKIAMRYGYKFQCPEWSDLIDMLKYLGKDLHNPYYVCPKDLIAMHDKMTVMAANKRKRLSEKMAAARQLGKEREELRRLEKQKEMIKFYPKKRKKFFGLIIEGKGIEIRTLQSVQEFMDEGAAMCHCVFANGYYDMSKHPNSLIMSAKIDGKRVETIEVDLKDYKIVQSRGKHNSVTSYHDTIVGLVNDNMDKIREINSPRRAKAI